MSSKVIYYNNDAIEPILNGINMVADAVKVTIGPGGYNATLPEFGTPQITKDGVTVARSIDSDNNAINMGVQLIQKVATKTVDDCGDGTSTSTLLAQALLNEGFKHIKKNKKSNAISIKKGMDKAKDLAVKYIKEYAEIIDGDNPKLREIAYVSSNGDDSIADGVVAAVKQVGANGIITMDVMSKPGIEVEKSEGLIFDRGFKSHYFINDHHRYRSFLEDVMVLIVNEEVSTTEEIINAVTSAATQGASLLLIAADVTSDALSLLTMNTHQNRVQCCAVRAPAYGERRMDILEDIATITGAKVISKDNGTNIKDHWKRCQGRCAMAQITEHKTTIMGGAGDEEAIMARYNHLKDLLESEELKDWQEEQIRERIAYFSNGMATISIGAKTDVELREKKDRVEDALGATRAAVDEGIVPGGGLIQLIVADRLRKYMDNANLLNVDEKFGYTCVIKALEKLTWQIAFNSGFNYNTVINKIKKTGYTLGFNAVTGELVDMKDIGIIDPAKVSRVTLENAVSIAGLCLTNKVLVVNKQDNSAIDKV